MRWFPFSPSSAAGAMFALILAGVSADGLADEPRDDRPAHPPLESGREIGDVVPYFYVRAVTGPLTNRSVCYVCRHAERPVVMIFLRGIGPQTPELLRRVDRYVDSHRADGVRAFGVLVTDDQRHAVSKLQTLSFDQRLSMPLTVAAGAVESSSNQKLNPEAAVTVVLYRQHRVVAKYAYRAEELDESDIQRIVKAVATLAEEPPTQAGSRGAGL